MRLKRNPQEETRIAWDYSTRCDICKNEIHCGRFERRDVDIAAAIGECYPESDQATRYKLDCCADCFLEKVKPLIEATFNVKFQEKSGDEESFPEEEVP